MKTGRPLPVEYLIVDVPAGAPVEPKFTFSADERVQPFPVENRMETSEIQVFFFSFKTFFGLKCSKVSSSF